MNRSVITPHDVADQLADKYRARQDLNEATTRRDIIDRVVYEVLSWPESAVRIEHHTVSGYLDYQLLSESQQPLLVIEAKRSGEYFALPRNTSKQHNQVSRVRLRTLLSHKPIRKAVEQAKAYATTCGSSFAVVTNGFEWIVFRAFVRGRNFDEIDALVIPGPSTLSGSFMEVTNILGYRAVLYDNALTNVLSSHSILNGDTYYPKKIIPYYDASVDTNEYAKYLIPIGNHILKDIPKDNAEFMTACYVVPRGQHDVEDRLRQHITDQITPYLENDGVSEVGIESGTVGRFARRIQRNLKDIAGAEVIILFGGKGAGKSTFLERLLFHSPPAALQNASIPVVIDMLACPQSDQKIGPHIWDTVCVELDRDRVLRGDIEGLLDLFREDFLEAKRQILAGLPENSHDFIKARNELVQEWKSNAKSTATALRKYWARRSRIPIVVLDNTDQLQGHMQDLSFLTAQEISRELECLVIISMREERYCRAKATGALDAYHNNGYHLPAAQADEVFKRRIQYIITLLDRPEQYHNSLGLPSNIPGEDLKRFLAICLSDFSNKTGHLKVFLERSSQNNLRVAIDFFRNFISSGYTNIREMLSVPGDGWTLALHQVVRPMMVPVRHNYDEDKSQIPNVYQLRAKPPADSSHFTVLRILRELRKTFLPSDNGSFTPVADIVAQFDDKFGMTEDCEANLDLMLRFRLIESNNRMEVFRERADGSEQYLYADALRITPYGVYLLEDISLSFAYLDLVCLDTGIRSEQLCNEFCRAANKEREDALSQKRMERLRSRVHRVEQFLKYLRGEEERERTRHNLSDTESGIVKDLCSAFENEKDRIFLSAEKRAHRTE